MQGLRNLHPNNRLSGPCVLLMVQESLLPTPTNINTIHVPGEDLLAFIAVQQWLHQHLGLELPLLEGCWVLVRSADLQSCSAAAAAEPSGSKAGQHHMQVALRPGFDSSTINGNTAAALSAVVPWRLRQVKAVQVAPGVDPADATLLLVGGERVTARDLGTQELHETQDYQVIMRPS